MFYIRIMCVGMLNAYFEAIPGMREQEDKGV
jgi:hypothetical protein